MPNIAAAVIVDGAAVSRTFSPTVRDAKGVFAWKQTTPILSEVATPILSQRQTSPVVTGKQVVTNNTVSVMLRVPVAETLGVSDGGITPPPTKAYELVARITLDLPLRSSKVERKDIRVLLSNYILSNANFVLAVDDLQPLF